MFNKIFFVKKIVLFWCFSAYFLSGIHAAEVNMVWGDPHANDFSTQFYINQSDSYNNRQLLLALKETTTKISPNELVLVNSYIDNTNSKILRYTQHYHDIPVWGYQIIFHIRQQQPVKVTGLYVNDIAKDIKTIIPAINIDDLLEDHFQQKNIQPKSLHTQLIIYIDEAVAPTRAHLAYHVNFFTKNNQQLQQPHYIIDASTGQFIKSWDGLHRARVIREGQGPGGNITNLDYRDGYFQYGTLDGSVPLQLGKFDVTFDVDADSCVMENDYVRIISFENNNMDEDDFPIMVNEEPLAPVFAYSCSAATGYLNQDDGGFAPIRGSFSPINDSMFFAQETTDMYIDTYNTSQPFGDNLPVRIYTHINDNGAIGAGAVSTIRENGVIVINQQLILPNNAGSFRPETQSTLAHELSHLLTSYYSDLVYEGQPGGLNESFSDMAEIALKDYINKTYSWYWDGEWTIGREESTDGSPVRYLYDPPLDGYSIDNANNFTDDMDPHYSSGVFNKAFYLLSQQSALSIEKAFALMITANQSYWVPTANFNFAACGVIQAAVNQGYSRTIFDSVFAQVGVQCKVGDGLFF